MIRDTGNCRSASIIYLMVLTMLWLEEKYINLLSSRLPRFHKVRHHLWNFRCVICGDSKKNEWKTRGSIYLPPKATNFVMGCFNCGASMSFSKFLKQQDNFLYDQYVLERYKAQQDEKQVSKPKEEVKQNKRLNLTDLELIEDLDTDHPAVKYLLKRQIDKKHFNRLYFVLRFKRFEAGWRGEKVPLTIPGEHPRLIIPFFDKQGNITRLSARAFGNEEPKYIYMKVKEDASRVFGLDVVKSSKLVYVLEGPLDSLFFDNAIAVGSADLIVPELKDYPNHILIPDNQPRNVEVCKRIKKMVESNHKVCLWNENWGKDINDMVLSGKTMDQIKTLIKQSTVSGIEAKLKFAQWVKCRV